MKTLLPLAALLLVSSGPARADHFPTCDRVPSSDVEAAFGVKVVRSLAVRSECRWSTPEPTVLVSAVVFEKGTQKVVREDSAKYVADSKKGGVSVTVTDEKPDLWCHQDGGNTKIGLPPGASCEAFVGKYRVTVDALGERMTTKQVKAFLEKLGARLK